MCEICLPPEDSPPKVQERFIGHKLWGEIMGNRVVIYNFCLPYFLLDHTHPPSQLFTYYLPSSLGKLVSRLAHTTQFGPPGGGPLMMCAAGEGHSSGASGPVVWCVPPTTGRYYVLHIACNFFVAAIHLDDVLAAYHNPLASYQLPCDSQGVRHTGAQHTNARAQHTQHATELHTSLCPAMSI